MGHDVLYCPKCHTPIMEGHNDWECDRCNLICDASTGFTWKNKVEVEPVPPQRELPHEEEIWKDWKGYPYQIIGIANQFKAQENQLVVFRSVLTLTLFVYSVEQFMGTIDGQHRFEKVEEMRSQN